MNPDRYSEPVDEARTESRRPRPIPMDLLLESGWPGEVLPRELADVTHWARQYVADPERDPAARARVQAVWLDGVYRAGWIGDRVEAKL